MAASEIPGRLQGGSREPKATVVTTGSDCALRRTATSPLVDVFANPRELSHQTVKKHVWGSQRNSSLFRVREAAAKAPSFNCVCMHGVLRKADSGSR